MKKTIKASELFQTLNEKETFLNLELFKDKVDLSKVDSVSYEITERGLTLEFFDIDGQTLPVKD